MEVNDNQQPHCRIPAAFQGTMHVGVVTLFHPIHRAVADYGVGGVACDLRPHLLQQHAAAKRSNEIESSHSGVGTLKERENKKKKRA